MTLAKEHEISEKALRDIAEKMMLAARTAPKGKGTDTITLALAEKEDIEKIAKRMIEVDEELDFPAFSRDAKNILNCSVMLVLGTKIKPLGLKKCGMCGYPNCAEKEKHPNHPCVFNTTDLGIAVGSAASVAMDHRVDNRILYTAGQAILDLNLLGDEIKVVYCIPISATSKNIFFDRG